MFRYELLFHQTHFDYWGLSGAPKQCQDLLVGTRKLLRFGSVRMAEYIIFYDLYFTLKNERVLEQSFHSIKYLPLLFAICNELLVAVMRLQDINIELHKLE